MINQDKLKKVQGNAELIDNVLDNTVGLKGSKASDKLENFDKKFKGRY